MNRSSSIIVLIFFLILFSCGDKQIVAIIGNEKIALKDFKERCQKKAQLLGQASLAPEQKKEVLEAMIQREIVSLHARQEGEKVSGEELDEATRSLSFLNKLRYKGEIENNLLFMKMKEKIERTIAVSKEDIESYYANHKEEFVQPILYKIYLVKVEQKNVDHVLLKLKKRPEAFDDMALKRVPPDLITINENAQLTPKDGFPEQMWPFIEKMNKGEIAGPVEVERGMFIFKLVDKQPETLAPLKDVYEKIKLKLTYEKRERAFETWYEGIKDDYHVEIKPDSLS